MLRRSLIPIFSLALAAGCSCSEIAVHDIPNEPPVVDILSHDDGDAALEGYVANFRANITDDEPPEASTATWFLGDEVICQAPPEPIGVTECGILIPLADSHRVRVEIQDVELAIAEDDVKVNVTPTLPPTATILAPLAGVRYYRNVDVPLVARLADAEDTPDLLVASWSGDIAGSIGTDLPADADGVSTSQAPLAQGPHTLTVVARDVTGKTGEATVTIDVGGDNHAPTCDILSPVDDQIATVDQPFLFDARANDEDVGPLLLTVTWSSDIQGQLDTVIPDAVGIVDWLSPPLIRGTHLIEMKAIDDAGWSCTDTVRLDVSNEAPTVPVVHIEPENPYALQDLVCLIDVESEDPEGEDVTHVFQWLRDGSEFNVTSTTTWPGDTIDAAYIAPGQIWVCEVRGDDGIGTGSPGVDSVTVDSPTVVSVGVGYDHSCQIDDAVTSTCWGSSGFGVLGLNGGTYTAITAGKNHTCALDPLGVVSCVGQDSLGQADTTGLVGTIVALEAGQFFNCALDASDGVQCWGSNTELQSDTSGLTGNYERVTAGFQHACAIEVDDDVVCWGSDAYGRATPPNGVKMSAVSAGTSHTCGIDLAGVLHCWGRDNLGQLDAPLGSFESLSCGDDFSCAVDGTGTIHCWGLYTDAGELNGPPIGTFTQVDVAEHACAVDDAGVATCWGENANGEATAPTIWW